MQAIIAIIASLLLQSVAYGYVSARYPSGNMMQFAFIACILCALFYELSLRIWPVEPHVHEDGRALRRIGIFTALSVRINRVVYSLFDKSNFVVSRRGLSYLMICEV